MTSTYLSLTALSQWNSQNCSIFTKISCKETLRLRQMVLTSTRRKWWWKILISSATLTTQWAEWPRWSQAKWTTLGPLWQARKLSRTKVSRAFCWLPTLTRSQRARRDTLKDTTMIMGSSHCKLLGTKTRYSCSSRATTSSTRSTTIQITTPIIRRHSS